MHDFSYIWNFPPQLLFCAFQLDLPASLHSIFCLLFLYWGIVIGWKADEWNKVNNSSVVVHNSTDYLLASYQLGWGEQH